MDRETFADMVKAEIEKQQIYYNQKDFIKQNYSNSKKGIYFLYNKNNDVIYVGMVGEGKSTSFYHRMYLHGNGAHCKKIWFNEVEKFRFKIFPNKKKREIFLILILMIYKNKQPKYNDRILVMKDYKEILNKIK